MTNLKKLTIAGVFGVFLLGSMTTQAQTVELIPKAGINISSQSISGMSGEKSKVGFQGGIGVNFLTKAKGFSIQPELNFISKGAALKNVSGNKENFNLNYLELPVLAKYSFGIGYINAGPSLGLRLGENDNVKNVLGGTKSLDFGLQMGAGLAIPAGSGKIIVDGRYNLGLSNIADNSKIKNRGVSFSLGYAIPLGK